MLGKTAGGTLNFFDTKNLYGWSESRETARALARATGKRGAVISRYTILIVRSITLIQVDISLVGSFWRSLAG
jgi:hypothetical protein